MGNANSGGEISDEARQMAEDAEAIRLAQIVHPNPPEISFARDGVPPVVRQDIEDVPGAFLLRGVLTEDECAAIVAGTEAIGYTEAPITTYAGPKMMRDIRTNKRLMMECSTENLEVMCERIREHVPENGRDGWTIKDGIFLNERFRFYRYEPNETFEPHFDGAFQRSINECTMLTFIVYLTNDFEGGYTTFYPRGATSFASGEGVKEEVRITPEIGTALVFWHQGPLSPFHEGSAHTTPDAIKFVLRSDVTYVRGGPGEGAGSSPSVSADDAGESDGGSGDGGDSG